MTVTINISTLIAQQLANNGIEPSQAIIDSIIKETVAEMIVKTPSVLTEIVDMSEKKQTLEKAQLKRTNQQLSNTVSELRQKLDITNRKVSGMSNKLDEAIKPKKTQEQKAFKQSTDGLAAILGQIAEQKMTPRNKTLIRELQAMVDEVSEPKADTGDAVCKTLSEEALKKLLHPQSDHLKAQLEELGFKVIDIPLSEPTQADFDLISQGFPSSMTFKIC